MPIADDLHRKQKSQIPTAMHLRHGSLHSCPRHLLALPSEILRRSIRRCSNGARSVGGPQPSEHSPVSGHFVPIRTERAPVCGLHFKILGKPDHKFCNIGFVDNIWGTQP